MRSPNWTESTAGRGARRHITLTQEPCDIVEQSMISDVAMVEGILNCTMVDEELEGIEFLWFKP